MERWRVARNESDLMRLINPEYATDASLIYTNVAEADYLAWNATYAYSINDMRTYVTANKHWVIRSLVNSNVGNIPTGLSTDTKWQKVSETNRWKMFDLKTTSQTFNVNSIDVIMQGIGFIDSVAALNIDGTSITIKALDQSGNTFYNVTKSLVSTEGIYDPYTYFFTPIVFITDLVVTDIPVYAFSQYQVTINKPDSIAKCGTLIIGKALEIGLTDYGMRIGVTDYSVKKADEFGDFTITERAYSKEMSLTTSLANGLVNSTINTFNNYRAKPVVWMGADDFSSSFIYGFYKDYGVVVAYPTYSIVQIEIEGLS